MTVDVDIIISLIYLLSSVVLSLFLSKGPLSRWSKAHQSYKITDLMQRWLHSLSVSRLPRRKVRDAGRLLAPSKTYYVHPCIFTGSNSSECVITRVGFNSYSCKTCSACWSCLSTHQSGVSN